MTVAAGEGVALTRPRWADDPEVVSLLARCTFPDPPAEVVCALSGGPDSTAMVALAVATGLVVRARLVHHGLRDTTADARAAAATCERLGVALEEIHLRVEPGPDLAARARTARHDVVGPDALLGHTADDRAETLLINLMRGAGPAGIGAMGERRRPVLGLRRRETAALCRHLDLPVVHDPTNDDPARLRARIRNEVLPLLDDIAGRDVAPVLARAASLSAAEHAIVEGSVVHLDPRDCGALRQAGADAAAVVVRRWLTAEVGEGYPPDRAAVERVLQVVDHTVRATEVAGHRIARHRDRLIGPEPVAPRHPAT